MHCWTRLGVIDWSTQDVCRPVELVEAFILEWILYNKQWSTLEGEGDINSATVEGKVLYQKREVPYRSSTSTTEEEYLCSSNGSVTLEGLRVTESIAKQQPTLICWIQYTIKSKGVNSRENEIMFVFMYMPMTTGVKRILWII